MREANPPHRRALAVLMAATAFIATPLVAQDAAPQTTPETAPQTAPEAAPQTTPPVTVIPPRVVPTIPENESVSAPARASGRQVGDPDSPTPVNAEAAAQAEAEQAERRPAARTAPRAAPARQAARSTTHTAAAAARPVAAPSPTTTPTTTPTPAATPTPVATPSPAASSTPAPEASATPVDQVDQSANVTDSTTTATAPSHGAPLWPLAVVVVLVLAGLAFFLMRRRRTDEDEFAYAPEPVVQETAMPMREPAPIEPVVAAAPVVATPEPIAEPAAPAVPDDATVVAADEEDVAALTAAAPVGDRPWLEFALRPLRAGTNADEALVEIELTVGNAGQVAADDVRIATYMVANEAEVAGLLASPPAELAVDPVTIAAGEGTRVDATLGLLRASLGGESFLPVIVADARYRLPDGGEGRTAAAFTIGRANEGSDALAPFDLGTTALYDDVEARLYREPDHA